MRKTGLSRFMSELAKQFDLNQLNCEPTLWKKDGKLNGN